MYNSREPVFETLDLKYLPNHAAFKDLEHLTVTSLFPVECVDVDRFIGGQRFPGFSHLRTLRLVHANLSASALSQLFGRGVRTLRVVDLEVVRLTEGRWAAVFSQMLELERLRYLYAGNCCYADQRGEWCGGLCEADLENLFYVRAKVLGDGGQFGAAVGC